MSISQVRISAAVELEDEALNIVPEGRYAGSYEEGIPTHRYHNKIVSLLLLYLCFGDLMIVLYIIEEVAFVV